MTTCRPVARSAIAVALLLAVAVLGSILETASASAAEESRLVYLEETRLQFADPSGAKLSKTGTVGSYTTDLAASENGRRVAMLQWVQTAGAHGDHYRVRLWTAGRGIRTVWASGPFSVPGSPSLALSPDGRLLALSVAPQIRIIDLRDDSRRIVRNPHWEFDMQPSFTADGKHLVFAHGKLSEEGSTAIYEISLGGGAAQRLTESDRDELFPQLSPDGVHLAFLRRAGRGFDLIVARIDTGTEHVIRHVRYPVSRPDFSPDGRYLTFATTPSLEGFPGGPWTVYTVRADGSRMRAVVGGIRGGAVLPQWTGVPD